MFASQSQLPIFICPEDGTEHLDVVRIPTPKKWKDVVDALNELDKEPHDFKTLVMDTMDWIEPLLDAHVCSKNNWGSLDDPGYGKGPSAALMEWSNTLIPKLERLRKERKMNILLLAHADAKQFRDPDGPEYKRYQLKLRPKSASLIKEWVDCVLFANFETMNVSKTGKPQYRSTGLRIVQSEHRNAWDAKNRYNLPAQFPLDYTLFEKHWKATAAQEQELEALLAKESPSKVEIVRNWIANHKDKPYAVATSINRLRTDGDNGSDTDQSKENESND